MEVLLQGFRLRLLVDDNADVVDTDIITDTGNYDSPWPMTGLLQLPIYGAIPFPQLIPPGYVARWTITHADGLTTLYEWDDDGTEQQEDFDDAQLWFRITTWCDGERLRYEATIHTEGAEQNPAQISETTVHL